MNIYIFDENIWYKYIYDTDTYLMKIVNLHMWLWISFIHWILSDILRDELMRDIYTFENVVTFLNVLGMMWWLL